MVTISTKKQGAKVAPGKLKPADLGPVEQIPIDLLKRHCQINEVPTFQMGYAINLRLRNQSLFLLCAR